MDKKPFGLKLNEKDNKMYELYEQGVPIEKKKEHNDMQNEVKDKVTHIGKWEIVPKEETFENKYKA
jgi:hypothetical protein